MEAATPAEKAETVKDASRLAKRYTTVDAADLGVNHIADALGGASAYSLLETAIFHEFIFCRMRFLVPCPSRLDDR